MSRRKPNGDNHDDELSDSERNTLDHGRCPTCGGRGFVWGPRGGLSLNIECAQISCRARYNVAILAGKVMHGHRIETRAEGGPRWPSEPQEKPSQPGKSMQ